MNGRQKNSFSISRDKKLTSMDVTSSLRIPFGNINPEKVGIQGSLFFNTETNILYISTGTEWVQSTSSTTNISSRENLLAYISQISNLDGSDMFSVLSYIHGATAVAEAYLGGVYSPFDNRIYFVPSAQSIEPEWHYIDCNTGNVVAYTHGATAVLRAYSGGSYDPVNKRIYFAPAKQGNQTEWHYIDCNTGLVASYTHGVTAVSDAYAGCVYSPNQKRIYFVPDAQSTQPVLHYIDCLTGGVVSYSNPGTLSYFGGVYSPTQDRIYFVPFESGSSVWHYIDCVTGDLVSYTHGATGLINFSYIGGAYSPTQNRIYFAPFKQYASPLLHYIDCETGLVIEYSNSHNNNFNYIGAVYSPTQNRIYFIPSLENGVKDGKRYYINCNNGELVEYIIAGFGSGSTYFGGVYSPTENRIYLVPNSNANQSRWHYYQDLASTIVSKKLMSSAEYNKL